MDDRFVVVASGMADQAVVLFVETAQYAEQLHQPPTLP